MHLLNVGPRHRQSVVDPVGYVFGSGLLDLFSSGATLQANMGFEMRYMTSYGL